MRIAIMGAGGVGSYFGARLAGSGEDVIFIARAAHLAALWERGLSVKSPRGNLRLETVVATEDPSTVGIVDIVVGIIDVGTEGVQAKSAQTCASVLSSPNW